MPMPCSYFATCLLWNLFTIADLFRCNLIKDEVAGVVSPEMVGEEICRSENACVTHVADGRLNMGCFNAVKQWDYIEVCFITPKNETGCSYNPETRENFNVWGAGMCCCRTDKCNELPPEWLSLSKWRFRWRIFSVLFSVFTFLSLVFFSAGFFEAILASNQAKKKKESVSSDSGSELKH